MDSSASVKDAAWALYKDFARELVAVRPVEEGVLAVHHLAVVRGEGDDVLAASNVGELLKAKAEEGVTVVLMVMSSPHVLWALLRSVAQWHFDYYCCAFHEGNERGVHHSQLFGVFWYYLR